MKIIKPSFEIQSPFGPVDREMGIQMLRFTEKQARISHRAEDQQTDTSWERFIKAVVIDHGDWSVVEHVSLTVVFRVDRGVTHELVRHRLFSFTQESTRFVNGAKKYPTGLEFIRPVDLEVGSWDWETSLEVIEKVYLNLLKDGARPQEARSVLPNALAATIAVTGNLRNWRHFLLMRTSKETHPDFRAITIPLLEQFKQLIPILFDDIQPNERQVDNLKKPR